MANRYDFWIADLLFRVESEKQLHIPDNFQPFYTANPPVNDPDILLQIVFETSQLTSGAAVRTMSGTAPQKDSTKIVRIHWKNGEYIVRQEPVGRGQPCRLFLPPAMADDFCRNGIWLNCMDFGRLLLPYDRMILHSSAVIHQGKALLFSAPSGGGKSTHASLWEKHYGAEILNGDKVVIHVTENGCTAYGSPAAGSSHIYNTSSAPIKAIYLLKKGSENRISPVTPKEAILSLYSEAIKSARDTEYNDRLLELIQKMQKQTPILSFACLPDKSAVECLLQ